MSPRVEQYMARVWDVASRRDCVSRRHHYVPQAYLRAWSPDGRRVRVLHTQTGLDRFQSVKDTCVKEDFYRVTDMDGVQHRQVEAMLSVIDDETATILDRLRAWQPNDDFAFDMFMSLAVVVAFQENRTPQRRRFMDQIAVWQAERLQQPELELPPDFHVDSLFGITYEAADQLSTRQLELWDDPKGRLLTSDQPVLMTVSGDEPPSTFTSPYVWWPISPTRMVVFSKIATGRKVEHRTMSRREVEAVRASVIRTAEAAIVAMPGDQDLPAGKVLPRRPQLRTDCWPDDPAKGKCVLRFAWGYGSGVVDNVCRPVCAVREPQNWRTRRADDGVVGPPGSGPPSAS